MDFCGLRFGDDVPDHITLNHFRSEIAVKKALGCMLKKLNDRLKDKGIMVHSDKAEAVASITKPT